MVGCFWFSLFSASWFGFHGVFSQSYLNLHHHFWLKNLKSLLRNHQWFEIQKGLFWQHLFWRDLKGLFLPYVGWSPHCCLKLSFSALWKSKCSRKVNIFSCILFQGKLNTTEVLQKKISSSASLPSSCVLWATSGESLKHLYFHCSYAAHWVYCFVILILVGRRKFHCINTVSAFKPYILKIRVSKQK